MEGYFLKDARKDIIFRDADYEEKFRIKDGDSIKITVAYDGEEIVRRCRWIDEAHMNVGSTPFHMDEFMERQTAAGNRYEPVPNLEPMLDILFVEPGQKPRDVQIPISMSALRELVGGQLDIAPFGFRAATVHGLTGPAPSGKSAAFAICGLNDGQLASLHPYSAQQYKRELALREQAGAEKKPSVAVQLSQAKKAVAARDAAGNKDAQAKTAGRRISGEAL